MTKLQKGCFSEYAVQHMCHYFWLYTPLRTRHDRRAQKTCFLEAWTQTGLTVIYWTIWTYNTNIQHKNTITQQGTLFAVPSFFFRTVQSVTLWITSNYSIYVLGLAQHLWSPRCMCFQKMRLCFNGAEHHLGKSQHIELFKSDNFIERVTLVSSLKSTGSVTIPGKRSLKVDDAGWAIILFDT